MDRPVCMEFFSIYECFLFESLKYMKYKHFNHLRNKIWITCKWLDIDMQFSLSFSLFERANESQFFVVTACKNST